MQFLHRSLLVVCLVSLFAGCASIQERHDFFAGLSPECIADAQWPKCTGVYTGPLRSTASAFGSTGATVALINIKIEGTPENPLIFLKMESACSSAWNASENFTETYTNIAGRKYGVRGRLLAFSHAPKQMLISLKPGLFSPNRGAALILTFQPKGAVNVDYIGHFGRTGSGILYRVLPTGPQS